MPPRGEDRERIEELKRDLYSRSNIGMRGTREHDLRSRDGETPSWEKPNLNIPGVEVGRRSTWLPYFLKFSAAFFALASLYAGYTFFFGGNEVSSENIDLEITGPISIGSGEKLTLLVKAKNRNRVGLEVADLLLEFPQGTRSAENSSLELPRYRESLGDLSSGKEVERPVSAVLFGEERAALDIAVTLEYRVTGSSAVFFKKTVYPVTISSAPVTLRVERPEEVASGDKITLTLSVTSNSKETAKGVLLKAEYPPGFIFSSSDPNPALLNNVFRLGDLPSGSNKTVRIRGSLSGEDGQERSFRFDLGLGRTDNDRAIGTPLASLIETIPLRKSLLGLALSINGGGPEGSSESGGPVRLEILVSNNLPTPVRNISAKLNFSGSALDKSSVAPSVGFYDSGANIVTWSQGTGAPITELSPGESATFAVTFSALGRGAISSLVRPEILFSSSVSGIKVAEGEESLSATASGRVRVTSDVGFDAKILARSGALKNSGPLPPKVGLETTYTVVLSATNGSNDLTSTKITAILPAHVSFKGETSPGESIFFDSNSRILTWDAGTIAAGAGISRANREAYFKVGFIPNANQEGQVPNLVENIQLNGTDSFTGSVVKITEPALTTRLAGDSGGKPGEEIVSP